MPEWHLRTIETIASSWMPLSICCQGALIVLMVKRSRQLTCNAHAHSLDAKHSDLVGRTHFILRDLGLHMDRFCRISTSGLVCLKEPSAQRSWSMMILITQNDDAHYVFCLSMTCHWSKHAAEDLAVAGYNPKEESWDLIRSRPVAWPVARPVARLVATSAWSQHVLGVLANARFWSAWISKLKRLQLSCPNTMFIGILTLKLPQLQKVIVRDKSKGGLASHPGSWAMAAPGASKKLDATCMPSPTLSQGLADLTDGLQACLQILRLTASSGFICSSADIYLLFFCNHMTWLACNMPVQPNGAQRQRVKSNWLPHIALQMRQA